MNSHLVVGVGTVLFAGLLQGVFAVPMKYARRWNYENTWLVFCLTGLLVFPWLLTSATVPHVNKVYATTSTKTLLTIAGFGICWGIGATLTGIGLTMLGIGLGFAIILGISASIGSLIPLLVLTPETLNTHQGHTYLLGTGIMLLGIGLSARAGALRDAGRRAIGGTPAASSFLIGLVVCCSSGLLSSTLNFSYAFGSEAIHRAASLGASSLWQSNVVTALAVSGGFLANLLYCAWLLKKNSTVTKFWSGGAGRGWLCGSMMGLFWFGGQSLYGFGVLQMGSFGIIAGWPLLMGMLIVTSNAAGVVTGEWADVSKKTGILLIAGMLTILTALSVLANAQHG